MFLLTEFSLQTMYIYTARVRISHGRIPSCLSHYSVLLSYCANALEHILIIVNLKEKL